MFGLDLCVSQLLLYLIRFSFSFALARFGSARWAFNVLPVGAAIQSLYKPYNSQYSIATAAASNFRTSLSLSLSHSLFSSCDLSLGCVACVRLAVGVGIAILVGMWLYVCMQM